MKMSPARRVLFALALVGGRRRPRACCSRASRTSGSRSTRSSSASRCRPPTGRAGTALAHPVDRSASPCSSLLEVFERLSLKNDLEIARDIQQAMLPRGLYSSGGLDAFGATRPANTVGGDFYDILPLPDGRVVIALGDVAGKGSPAALLMAILLAMLRTLLDEGLDAVPLIEPPQRPDPAPRALVALHHAAVREHRPGHGRPRGGQRGAPAGAHPPAQRRVRAPDRGRHRPRACSTTPSTPPSRRGSSQATCSCSTATASPRPRARRARPSTRRACVALIRAHADNPSLPDIGKAIIKAVERHAQDVRFADDLTVLLARDGRTRDPGLGLPARATGRPPAVDVRRSISAERSSDV